VLELVDLAEKGSDGAPTARPLVTFMPSLASAAPVEMFGRMGSERR
jgi:hypothetical protein